MKLSFNWITTWCLCFTVTAQAQMDLSWGDSLTTVPSVSYIDNGDTVKIDCCAGVHRKLMVTFRGEDVSINTRKACKDTLIDAFVQTAMVDLEIKVRDLEDSLATLIGYEPQRSSFLKECERSAHARSYHCAMIGAEVKGSSRLPALLCSVWVHECRLEELRRRYAELSPTTK